MPAERGNRASVSHQAKLCSQTAFFCTGRGTEKYKFYLLMSFILLTLLVLAYANILQYELDVCSADSYFDPSLV